MVKWVPVCQSVSPSAVILKMETACLSDMLLPTNQTAWFHNMKYYGKHSNFLMFVSMEFMELMKYKYFKVYYILKCKHFKMN